VEGVYLCRKAHRRPRSQPLGMTVADERGRAFGRRVRLPFRAARATNSARTRLWRRTAVPGRASAPSRRHADPRGLRAGIRGSVPAEVAVCARSAQHAARRAISVAVLTLRWISPRGISVATAFATARTASGCDPKSLEHYTLPAPMRPPPKAISSGLREGEGEPMTPVFTSPARHSEPHHVPRSAPAVRRHAKSVPVPRRWPVLTASWESPDEIEIPDRRPRGRPRAV